MKLLHLVQFLLLLLTANAFANEKTLHLGYTPLYPFIWEDGNGKAQGLYVDVLNEALRNRLDYDIHFSKYPYRRLKQYLEKGSVDAYINIGKNESNFLTGAIPIAVGMISVFTYKNHPRIKEISDIDFIDDLKDLTIISHIGDQWATQHLEKFRLDTSAVNSSQVLRKLAKKRGDVVLVHETIGINTIYAEGLSDQIVLASRLTTNPVLHKLLISQHFQGGERLADQLDATLIEMLNDGTTSAIYRRYGKKHDLTIEGNIEESKVRIAHYAGDAVGSVLEQIAIQHNLSSDSKTPPIKSLFLDLIPYKDAIKYTLLGPNPPELFMTWAGYRTKFFVDNNVIEPLGLGEADLKQFDEYSLSAISYNDQVYALPWNHHIIPVIFNKRVFDKYGIQFPTNFDKTLEVCKILTKNNVVPFALGSKNKWPAQFWFDYLLLRTAGKEFRDQLLSGKKHFTDSRVKHAFKLWAQLLEQGCIDQQNTEQDFIVASKKVAEGEAAMTVMGTWAAGTFEYQFHLKYGEDFDIAPFPTINKDIPDYLLSVQDVLVRTKNTNSEKIVPILKYLASAEVQLMYSRASGSPAPNKTIKKEEYPEMQKKMLELTNSYPNNLTTFDLSAPPLMAEIAMNLFKQFLLNPSSIDQLLIEADKNISEALKTKSFDF